MRKAVEDYAKDYGQQCRMEGRAEGRKEMIANMLYSGKSPGEIALFTGIPLEEVKAVEEFMCANA